MKSKTCVIDTLFAAFHYRYTVVLLIVFSTLISSKQFFGKAIKCTTADKSPIELLNLYCWLDGTYSSNGAWESIVGQEVPFPGVSWTNEIRVYHGYYHWVPLVFLAQAIGIYIPRYIRKSVICSKINKISTNLDDPITNKESKEENLDRIADYFVNTRGQHHYKHPDFTIMVRFHSTFTNVNFFQRH